MPAVDVITSTRNAHVRELARLSRPRVRRERGRHLVEGPNAVREALRADLVDEVLLTPDAALPDGSAHVPVTRVADEVLSRLAETATPQGIVAVVRTPAATLDEVVGAGLLAVLHEVADPGNAGTILRTADAAGATGVVTTVGSVDVFGPKAVRSAAGSTYHLPVVTDVPLAELAATCRDAGQRMLGLDAGGAMSVVDLEVPSGPLALVLGNEAHGLPASARQHLDALVAVPIHGRAESLNVAAAAAVALYAAARGQGLGSAPPPSTPSR